MGGPFLYVSALGMFLISSFPMGPGMFSTCVGKVVLPGHAAPYMFWGCAPSKGGLCKWFIFAYYLHIVITKLKYFYIFGVYLYIL